MSEGLTLSALDWWIEAGADVLVEDDPRDWLATVAPPPAAAVAPDAAPVPPAPPAQPIPQDLAEFRRWLLADPSVPGAAAARIDAAGDPVGGTVVVVDMPEAGDRAAGQLLAGDAGALFDRMLAAMTLTRGGLYLLPFAPARPAAGRIGAEAEALTALARHHLALARPARLLLLGDAPVRALTGLPLAQARGAARTIDIGGAAVPAVASFHPRFVLERPDYRKAAWADLQLFMGL